MAIGPVSNFTIAISPEQFDRAFRELTNVSNGVNRACAGAINDVLTSARSQTARRLSAIINLPAGRATNPPAGTISYHLKVRKAFHGGRSGNARLSGTLSVVGGGMDAMLFKPRQTKTGVTIKVNKTKGQEKWRSAFIATMKNGKRGVFERLKGQIGRLDLSNLPSRFVPIGQPAIRPNQAFLIKNPQPVNRTSAYFPASPRSGRVWRLPIVKRWGPTPYGVFVNAPGVAAEVLASMQTRLNERLLSKIDYLLGRVKVDRSESEP